MMDFASLRSKNKLLMTKREIKAAAAEGRLVVLRDDPWHTIVPDVFGDLVITSRRNDGEPVRKATLGDLRRAKYLAKDKPKKH